jgi:transcriptional regulator with XRE-family HTH domain
MKHATAHIAATLRTAREAKGISQRALSEKAGVPQGHISKIENGAVDLRVSSLVELARVLDLELTLVPRKSLPAVNSIVRSTTATAPREGSYVTRKTWNALLRKLDKLSHADPANMELAQLQRLTRDLQYLGFTVIDRETLRDVNKRVDAVLEKHDSNGIHRLLLEFKSLRNAAAHSAGNSSVTNKVRPAYSLEEDDHGE